MAFLFDWYQEETKAFSPFVPQNIRNFKQNIAGIRIDMESLGVDHEQFWR